MAANLLCPRHGHCRAKRVCPLGAITKVTFVDPRGKPCQVRHGKEGVNLPVPRIVLSSKRRAGSSASYSPRYNKIKLRGASRTPEEIEGFLAHELAHWAQFLAMSPEERTFTAHAYSAEAYSKVPHNERVLEKIAFQMSGYY